MTSIPSPPDHPLRPSTATSLSNIGQIDPDIRGTVIHGWSSTYYIQAGRYALHQYKLQCERNTGNCSDRNLIYLSYYNPVIPIIQSGPLCGLVAVSMASQLVSKHEVSTEQLLQNAITLGYTKQGEMFSACIISGLIKSLSDIKFNSEVVCKWDEKQMIQYLLQGDLLLVPYDADKNHSPCLKMGHKAHWMLITGFFAAVDSADTFSDMTEFEDDKDSQYASLYHIKPSNRTSFNVLKQLQSKTDAIREILPLAHHGKSKFVGAWTLTELYNSNHQLKEIGPKRTEEEFILPEGGVEKGLCGQLVRIFHHDHSL